MLPTRPAAVVFDMDGVIFDSESLSRDAFAGTVEELGLNLTMDDFMVLVGRPRAVNSAYLRDRLGGEPALEAFRAVWNRRHDAMLPGLALKPGVVELLDHIAALGLPHAICTSSGPQAVGRNLAQHGLTGRFPQVVAAGDYARGKPAPDPFLRAADVLGLPPSACLALEDSHNGVRAAASAGMVTVMVPDLSLIHI